MIHAASCRGRKSAFPRPNRATVAASFGLCGVLALAGCGGSDHKPGAAAQPKAGGGPGATIGVVINTLADVNQADILRGVKDQGKKYGWTVKSTDTQSDPAKANAAMRTFVQQKVAGIFVTVYSGSVMQAGLTAARAAKIPVILDGANDLVPGVAAIIPLGSGEEEGKAVVEALGGSGSVLAFTFPPGAPCVAQWEQSKKVFDANPGVEYTTHDVPAPGWITEGQKATAAWLQTHPAGSSKLAIWGCWDGPTFGAIAALTAAKRKDVKVFGNGGEPDAINAIRSGKMTASIFYDQYTGGGLAGAQLLHDALVAGDKWTPKAQPNSFQRIDASNVKEVCAKYPTKCK